MPKPSIGRIVHYVSHGTPPRPDGSQAFTSQCRAAVVTAVGANDTVDLFVMNPTGLFLNQDCRYDDGAEHPGSPDCPDRAAHGNPFRYCACGWTEASHAGGTWHWPERVE
jgi:hypothetical protein